MPYCDIRESPSPPTSTYLLTSRKVSVSVQSSAGVINVTKQEPIKDVTEGNHGLPEIADSVCQPEITYVVAAFTKTA